MTHDAQYADHAMNPYAPRPDANAWQSALESAAHDEYEKRGPEFASWLHERWIPENANTLTALVCLAGGLPGERIAASVIADNIYDEWMQSAMDAGWCRDMAQRRMG